MARNPNNQPILLIMDGHGSHCTDKMLDYGIAQNPPVHLFLFPPHTTHRLQPLDVGVFGIAQRLYLDRSDLCTYQGQPITRATVISEWMSLRPRFMTEKIIASSWAHTGNYPINPNVFTDDDYAPSHTYSTHTHLPAGYPVEEDHSDTDSSENFEIIGVDGHAESEQTVSIVYVCADQHEIELTLIPQHEPSTSDDARQPESSGSAGNKPQSPQALPSKKDLQLPDGFRIDCRQDVYRELARLRTIAEVAFKQAEEASAHAKLMAKENGELRRQINAPKPGRSRKQNTQSRFLTGEEGLKLHYEAKAKEVQGAKEAEEKLKQARDLEEERQRHREAEAPTTVWGGAWQNRAKPNIQDLAFALDLSIDGTKGELVERIRAHLETTPSRKADERFAGLYAPVTRGRRRKPPTTVAEQPAELIQDLVEPIEGLVGDSVEGNGACSEQNTSAEVPRHNLRRRG